MFLRINDIADDKADLLLSNGFWLDHVMCTPWRSRQQPRDGPPRMQTDNAGRRSTENRNVGSSYIEYYTVAQEYRFSSFISNMD